MIWHISDRADPFAADIADRHYSRQKPGTPQFVPTGACLVLKALTATGRAYWVTSFPQAKYVKHRWAGAWICSAFRSEGAGVASSMVLDAVAATLAFFGEAPSLGMVTFVDPRRVRPTMVRGRPVFGWCFRKAGFMEVGVTETRGLLALQLTPDRMPPPTPAIGTHLSLFEAAS